MKAIIPTGGRGTRMQPVTFSMNKHFIPVGNKLLIHYPIETIAETGIREVAITYNPGWLDAVKEMLGDGSRWGMKFTYVLQEKPLGLANIIQVCEEFINGDSFVFHLGDNIFADGIKDAVDRFNKNKPDALVYMLKHPENRRMGVPIFDKKGRLVKYVEKPKNPPNSYAIPGVYLFQNNIFKCFKGKNRIVISERGEYEISTAFQWLIDNGYKVDVLEYKGKWLDPGKFDDWLDANRHLLDIMCKYDIQSKIPSDTRLEGRVSIGKTCKLVGSEIRGPSAIGDRVSIINSYIGPYTSVSDGCRIENSHVENSVLMKGVTIRKIKQPINQSIIGTDTEIYDQDGPSNWLRLFVGEKCKIQV